MLKIMFYKSVKIALGYIIATNIPTHWSIIMVAIIGAINGSEYFDSYLLGSLVYMTPVCVLANLSNPFFMQTATAIIISHGKRPCENRMMNNTIKLIKRSF